MVLVFWMFVWYLIYTRKESKNETIVLIRELTINRRWNSWPR